MLWRGRSSEVGIGLALALLGPSSPMSAASDDRPIVTVSRQAVTPARLDVHVGEVIRWRAPAGERLQIELDPHRGAHEVVVRSGEVYAVFRQPGEHWYTGSLVENGRQSFRGVVVVEDTGTSPPLPFTCGPESSARICIAP